MVEEAVEDIEVLIVGAGPTGLLLASELVRRGVRCQLVDAHDGPLEWDRATVVHPRSLEIFGGLGLMERLLAVGVKQRKACLHSDGAVLGEIDLADCGSRYGYNVGVSEQVTESLLADHLRSVGGDVARSERLVGLEDRGDGVVATMRRGEDERRYAARFVVGCDGLRSAARQLSGIELSGHDIPSLWAVFDVSLGGWSESYEANYVYLDQPPVILTALPDRRWRVYTRPTSDESDVVADARGTLGRYYPEVTLEDVTGATRFRCGTRVADHYRRGRVLLAGDAAHVCSPAEGHGMNSGMQDAFNLGWKLAMVCGGAADIDLLDSYEEERRPVAERITASGDATEAAHTLVDPTARRQRDEALRATLSDPSGQHQETVAEAELDIDYAGSSIVSGTALDGLWPGQRLSNLPEVVLAGEERGRLDHLTRPEGHTVLLLAGPGATAGDVAGVAEEVRSAAHPSLCDAVEVVACAPDPDGAWPRLDAEEAAALGVVGPVIAVVRPDGHFGLVADRDHAEALVGYQRLVAPHLSSPTGALPAHPDPLPQGGAWSPRTTRTPDHGA